jgi:hypothetical protein
MDITNYTVKHIDSINITGLGISSIEGIKYFDSLHIIEAGFNNIADVSRLPQRIISANDGRANFSHNLIDSIGFSLAQSFDLMGVKTLDVSYNNLSGNFGYNLSVTWKKLNISHNQIVYLSISAADLVDLDCSYNQIQNIIWYSSTSQLLSSINASHNNLSYPPLLSAATQYANLSVNNLSTINYYSTGLTYFNIDSNNLTYLDSLPLTLQYLYVANNHLIRLQDLPNGLLQLYCFNNNLSCLPPLPNTLNILQATGNNISCLPNIPSGGFTADVAVNGGTYYTCAPGVTCNNTLLVSGKLWSDANNNQVIDGGDSPMANKQLKIQPGNITLNTDNQGNYSFTGLVGITYIISPLPVIYNQWQPDTLHLLVEQGATDTSGFDFLGIPITPYSDIAAYVTEVVPISVTELNAYSVNLINKGNQTENGQLVLIVDPALSNGNANPAATIIADTVKWNFTSLAPGENRRYDVNFTVPSLPLNGYSYKAITIASIQNTDSIPANNIDSTKNKVQSYFPGTQKIANPKYYTATNIAAGDYLYYTVLFKNPNSGTVNHVWIIDTLSSQFDMSTFSIIGSSHNYSVQLNGRALRVDYNGINLPDSLSDPIGACGFFKFRVKPVANGLNGSIQNTAYVYYDGVGSAYGCGVTVCTTPLHISIDTIYKPKITYCGFVAGTAYAIANGTSPFVYQWSNGSNVRYTDIDTGIVYYLTVTDACTTTAITSVSVDAADTLRGIDFQGITLYICNGGTIDATVPIPCYDPNDPLTYLWNTGDTTQHVTGLTAGTYSCFVSDSLHIFGGTQYFDVVETNTDSIVIPEVHTCAGGNPYIELIENSTGPYTYLWGDGSTNSNINFTSSGYYSYTVTDGNGCLVQDSIYAQTIKDLVTYNITFQPPNCNTVNASISVQANISAPFSFSNAYLSGQLIAANTQQLNYSSNQAYVGGNWLQLYITDGLNASSCSADSLVQIPIGQRAIIYDAQFISSVSCYGLNDGYVSIDVHTGADSIMYLWSNGNTTDEISTAVEGSYDVTVTNTDGCSFTTGMYVGQPDPITINSSYTDVTCYGAANGSISLNVNGGTGTYTYSWNHSGHTDNLSNLQGGTYYCTVYDQNGCSAEAALDISEPDSLAATLTVQNVTDCSLSNGSVQINNTSGGVGPYSYTWSNGGNGMGISNLPPATYQLTITDANSCVSTYTETVTCPLGIADVTDGSGIKLYPVPANSILHGTVYGDINGKQYCIHAADGKLIVSNRPIINNNFELNISGYAAGVYYITVSSGNQSTVSRFVKK